MKKLALLLLLLAGTARAQSTTHIWAPVRPDNGVAQPWVSTIGLHCFAWVAEDDFTGGDTVLWFVETGVTGGGLCSVTVYSGDGNTQIVTTGPTDCSTPGGKTATSLPAFAFSKGTKYQLCTCQGGSGGAYMAQFSGPTNVLRDLQNSLSVPIATFGNNDCTNATAPATTGGIFSAITAMSPIVEFLTSTP